MKLQRIFKNGWMIALAVGVAVVLQGCLDSGDVYNPNDFLVTDIEAIKEYVTTNSIDAQFDTASGIFFQIHKTGDGYKAVKGSEVDLHFRGVTLDGREFVNTFSGLPERINLGVTNEYPTANPASYSWGLDEWIFRNQREGDSLTLYLPSPYGFKDQGYASVGPNTPVIYHVKFVDIKLLSEDMVKIDQYIEDKSWTSAIEPSYGTRYVVHTAGDAGVNIDFGDFVSINYKGNLLNGTVFDSNYTNIAPWTFTLGQTNLIPGFELGLDRLSKGDSATFFVPSIYGYGKNANGPIPANSPLVFTVSVRDVIKRN
jgi:FKBP-type peptidyl-prolyl cis-trans isomerase